MHKYLKQSWISVSGFWARFYFQFKPRVERFFHSKKKLLILFLRSSHMCNKERSKERGRKCGVCALLMLAILDVFGKFLQIGKWQKVTVLLTSLFDMCPCCSYLKELTLEKNQTRNKRSKGWKNKITSTQILERFNHILTFACWDNCILIAKKYLSVTLAGARHGSQVPCDRC